MNNKHAATMICFRGTAHTRSSGFEGVYSSCCCLIGFRVEEVGRVLSH